MSRPNTATITCPECSHEEQFTYWSSVNVTLHPHLKDKLLRRELTTFTCPRCGEKTTVVYEMLYHDMDRRLMVSLTENGDPPPELDLVGPLPGFLKQLAATEKSYTLRRVASINELIEKVRIFDDGLDDRTIEMFKIAIRLREDGRPDNSTCYYSGESTDSSHVGRLSFDRLREDGTSVVYIEKQTFRDFELQFAGGLPDVHSERGKWMQVDGKYAWAMIHGGRGL